MGPPPKAALEGGGQHKGQEAAQEAEPETEQAQSKTTQRWLIAGAALVSATVFFSGGCRRKVSPAPTAPPLLLLPVEITDASPGAEHLSDTDLETIRVATREQIQAAGLARALVGDAAASDVASLRVRVLLGCERVAADGRALERVAAEIKLEQRPGSDPEAIHADLLATGVALEKPSSSPSDKKNAAALCGELATRTVRDRVGRYLAAWRLRTAPAGEVGAALAADAGTARVEAIRLVGERRLLDLAPQLLTLLTDEDEETRDAALGALLRLKDRRAVKVLTRDRSLGDRHELRKILDAVGELGGEDAQEYLSFVADTHDDPEIKRMAAQALARLRRADAGAI